MQSITYVGMAELVDLIKYYCTYLHMVICTFGFDLACTYVCTYLLGGRTPYIVSTNIFINIGLYVGEDMKVWSQAWLIRI